jgi:hypothetical protein
VSSFSFSVFAGAIHAHPLQLFSRVPDVVWHRLNLFLLLRAECVDYFLRILRVLPEGVLADGQEKVIEFAPTAALIEFPANLFTVTNKRLRWKLN